MDGMQTSELHLLSSTEDMITSHVLRWLRLLSTRIICHPGLLWGDGFLSWKDTGVGTVPLLLENYSTISLLAV